MATSAERDTIMGAVIGRSPNGAGWVRVNCPVCPSRKGSEDKRISLGYRPLTGGFRCFRCHVNGRMDGDGYIPPEEADGPDGEDKPAVRIDHEDFFSLWSEDLRNSPALADARAFLEERGITEEHWYAANIHAAIGGYYDGRIIVPHENPDGTWWGFTGRLWRNPTPQDLTDAIEAALGGKPAPKVLYPKNMDRGRMYNDQALEVETDRPCMVVEGCLDAAWYMPDAVASLGKPTPSHFEQMLEAKRPLVICLDGDAWEEGRALSYKLKLRGKRASFVRLPPQEDPNSVDPDWLRNQVADVAQTESHATT